jgi:GNAT superfamily N-acetyltransferase
LEQGVDASGSSTVRVESFTGTASRRFIPDLARLRAQVFRDFPYLYEAAPDYEENYLRTYTQSPDSVIVIAFDGAAIVGAATALPLEHEPDYATAPFRAGGYDLSKLFYCGESVLDRRYRGRGLGVAFFDHREAWARTLGRFTHSCFCGVVRPANHPRRPKDYIPLDAFWQKRGYRKMDGVTTEFTWRDLDEAEATPKRMQFWMKELR